MKGQRLWRVLHQEPVTFWWVEDTLNVWNGFQTESWLKLQHFDLISWRPVDLTHGWFPCTVPTHRVNPWMVPLNSSSLLRQPSDSTHRWFPWTVPTHRVNPWMIALNGSSLLSQPTESTHGWIPGMVATHRFDPWMVFWPIGFASPRCILSCHLLPTFGFWLLHF